MPTITVQVTDEVSRALTRQARALLLGRKTYVRAILAAVAAQADRDRRPDDPAPDADEPAGREVAP